MSSSEIDTTRHSPKGYEYYHIIVHVNHIRAHASEIGALEIFLKNTSNEKEILKILEQIEELCIKMYPLTRDNKEL